MSGEQQQEEEGVKKRKRRGVTKPASKKSVGLFGGRESIPIFTDGFLHLCREQKSSLRILKKELNELNERKKFQEIQREQIRLTNEKIRRDLDEINTKTRLAKERIERLEQSFEHLHPEQEDLIGYLEKNLSNPSLNKIIEEIVRSIELN